MGKYSLGEFEEVVMLTVGVLYENAYGVAIKKQLEKQLERKVSVGALQAALKRLEDKKYLSGTQGGATEARAGRPKRFYKITAEGLQAIKKTREIRNDLWSAIPLAVLRPDNSLT